MTTVAYRAGVMAGDSCWSEGSIIITSQPKVFILKSGALYGGAGDTDDRTLVAFLDRVRQPDGIPNTADLRSIESEVCALLAFPNKALWYIETGGKGQAFPVHQPYFAIGSGREFALAAMDTGLGAVDAVKLACTRDVYSRPPVHQVKLGRKK